MRDYLSSEVRNVCVIGHSGAGKTSVLESMLYYTKATDRFGKTSEGSSMIDFDAEEIRRGISVYTSIVPIEWEDCKINFIDTPGYLDFVGEKQAGFAVGDSCLIVANAKDVLESGTRLAYKQAIAAKNLQSSLLINLMKKTQVSRKLMINFMKPLVRASFHLKYRS